MVDTPDFLTTSWILAQFHRSPRRAIELYRKFVKQGRGVEGSRAMPRQLWQHSER
jgi:hypothetical protein